MEMLGRSFSGTIQDMLDLEAYGEGACYILSEIEMFQSLSGLDTWGMTMETEEKLTERNLVRDITGDMRSRQVNILVYEGVPFAIYQYIGKGNVENEVIFNKDVYLKFLKDYMNEYIEKKTIIGDVDLEYTAQNYDYGVFFIEDNTITSICKTRLNEYTNKRKEENQSEISFNK